VRKSSRGRALEDFLELGALPGAVSCARLHIRRLLLEWGLARLCDDAEIIASELITNAVKASQSMPQAFSVRLWLASDLAQVLVIVWDASPQPPMRTDAGSDAESGRGLMLVEVLSAQWGWHSGEVGDGKFVWALIRAR
jgi:anti-sigma regulatory factor (Ser/Thr protein kinase)